MRALSFSQCCWSKARRASAGKAGSDRLPQIPLGCISHFWNMRLIPRREDSRTFSAMIAGGTKPSDPKIVMGAPCGRLERF